MIPEIYSAVFWLQLALAVIGIGGLIAALRTLKGLERQTKATEMAARAAQESAETASKDFVLSHYAYFDLKWKIKAVNPRTQPVQFFCQIINTGNIPAIIRVVEIHYASDRFEGFHNATIYPSHDYWFDYEIEPAKLRWEKLEANGLLIGRIRYEYAFGGRRRKFAYAFSISNDGSIARIAPMEGSVNNDEEDDQAKE